MGFKGVLNGVCSLVIVEIQKENQNQIETKRTHCVRVRSNYSSVMSLFFNFSQRDYVRPFTVVNEPRTKIKETENGTDRNGNKRKGKVLWKIKQKLPEETAG